MNFKLTASPFKKTKTDFLIIPVSSKGITNQAIEKNLDKLCREKIHQLVKKNIFQAKLGQTFLLADDKVLLVGTGTSQALKPYQFKRVLLNTSEAIKTTNLENVICLLSFIDVIEKDIEWKIKLMVMTLEEGFYCFDVFKSQKAEKIALKLCTFAVEKAFIKNCENSLKQGLAIAKGVSFAKNLGNTPSNICTPTFIAKEAQVLAKRYKDLKVNILGEKEMKKLKMGALLAVSQGSAQEAKLIVIKYRGGNKHQAPIAFVGKGVTFDTGGISLKPADSMVGMKYDMCGGASVLGTMLAIAELKLSQNVFGLIAAVENMPGGSAYKPEDILTSMSGQTIEVISTDAEGRLALCDALTYCEHLGAETVIDIATLTGAVVIALGNHASGLLSNDEKLSKDLLQAGEDAFDRAWPLPLWDEYEEQLKSPFADMSNLGGRSAGTITAASFLSKFTRNLKWAHLDVAGTAATMMLTADRKATGRPVPLLIQYLINRKKQQ